MPAHPTSANRHAVRFDTTGSSSSATTEQERPGSAGKQSERRPRAATLKLLVGSGDRIMLSVLPFVVAGVALNVAYPSPFRVGGPSPALTVVAILMLTAGVTIWVWSVALILVKVPRNELITSGPYALVKHPLYTGVALLVLPAIGLILDTWLGAALGIIMYLASRRFSRDEEADLAAGFGATWESYCQTVRIPWL